MKKLKTGLSIVIFLLVLAYALAFSAHNSQALALNFLVGLPVSWPAALWLGMALLVGAVLGFISSFTLLARQKLQLRRLNKELNDTKQRLNKLS